MPELQFADLPDDFFSVTIFAEAKKAICTIHEPNAGDNDTFYEITYDQWGLHHTSIQEKAGNVRATCKAIGDADVVLFNVACVEVNDIAEVAIAEQNIYDMHDFERLARAAFDRGDAVKAARMLDVVARYRKIYGAQTNKPC